MARADVRRLEGPAREDRGNKRSLWRGRGEGWFRLDLRRLQWITIIAPPLFIILLAVASYVPHRFGLLSHEGEHALVAGVLIAAALAFSPVAFHVIRDAQRQLATQNAELAMLHRAAIGWGEALDALHRAALAVTSELSLHAVLQRVVDLSRQLVQAEYGALAVRGPGNQAKQFVTSGLSTDDAIRFHLPADGPALLNPASEAGQAAARDAPGGASLRIPITFQGRDIGALFLLSRSAPFSEQEAKLLSMFALQAAIAIENARLYEQVQRVAVIEERERIARDIHDGLGQLLGYLNTKAQAVGELLASDRYDLAATQVEELAEAAQELHGDMREAITGLRTAGEPKRGLVAALRDVVHRFRDRSRLTVRLEVPIERSGVSWGPTVDGELARIVQEALTNVRKHAYAQRAWVRVGQAGELTMICIEDDGRGFDPAQPPGDGFGLRCMAERAATIGAGFQITSEPGRGTRVEVTLPNPEMALDGVEHARPCR